MGKFFLALSSVILGSAILVQGLTLQSSWNSFLSAEGIFPAHLDAISGGRTLETGHLGSEIETLLDQPGVLEQLYTNFLAFATPFERTAEVRASRSSSERAEIFRANLIQIANHNAEYQAGTVSWFLGVTAYTDWTQEEFRSAFRSSSVRWSSNATDSLESANIASSSYSAPPATIDYRSKNVVSPVKNQGQCGCCYAFAAMAVLESKYAILNKGTILDLSEQEIRDCTTSLGNKGCNGGSAYYAFQYARDKKGITSESSYPYKQDTTSRSCSASGARSAPIKTYTWLNMAGTLTETALQQNLADIGPLAIGVDSSKWPNTYKGGAYKDCSSDASKLDHAVTLVGYDNSNYIVKNSWGSGWGDKGFIYLPKGSNTCGITNEVFGITALA